MYFTIKDALKYPFKRFKGLWNFYWILIPMFGWFALQGYVVQIYQAIFNGENKELPKFDGFNKNMKKGFFWMIAAMVIGIPYAILQLIFKEIPFIGDVIYFVLGVYMMLLSPLLVAQYAKTEKVKDGFDIAKATKTMFIDFGGYVIVHLKLILMNVIVVIITLPVIIKWATFMSQQVSVPFLPESLINLANITSFNVLLWISILLLIIMFPAINYSMNYGTATFYKKLTNAKVIVKNEPKVKANWVLVLLMSIFFGSLGVDRYIMGKVGTGLLKMITFGGVGIWWLVDIILIASKHRFKDVEWIE